MEDDSRLRSLLEANQRFYQVFETLDFRAMEALWEQSDRVFCVHPGWAPVYGERPVLDSWKRIIENTATMHIDLINVQARLEGKIGVVTLFEQIQSLVGQERHSSGAISTNLFSFDESSGLWKLYHHHASNAVVPDEFEHGPLN